MEVTFQIFFPLFDLRVFNNSLLGKENDSNLVIILHVLVLQKKKENTSGQDLSNELCVHAFVTKFGHNCGNEEVGKKGTGRRGEGFHIDTYTRCFTKIGPNSFPPTHTIPTMIK